MTPTLIGLRLAAAALLAATAGLAISALTTPASAATGFTRTTVSATTANDSNNKGIRVDCPDDTVLIGTSASIGGGEGQVRLDQIMPYTDHLYVHATEDADGTDFTWSVGATAFCSDAVTDQEIVSSSSTPAYAADAKQVVKCTGDNEVLGMGFLLNGAHGRAGVTEFSPTTETEATVVATLGAPYLASWGVTAYAICADPLPGHTVVRSLGSDQSSFSSLSKPATCPTDTKVTGGGGQMIGANPDDVILEDFTATPTSYSVKAYEDQDGNSGQWHLDALAICVTG